MFAKPTLAVFKFASCDGCQLSLLAAEDELLAVTEVVEIAYFLEARSQVLGGPYDIGLVEGSITTAHDAERIKEIRLQCKYLVTIGACATSGGIQALRNWGHLADFIQRVYAHPEYVESLNAATPVSEHVKVDAELHGCPISPEQLREVLVSVAVGRRPQIREEAVCLECKRRGTVCVMVAEGIPCLGPVTQSGCGALCPMFRRGCFGCFGPREQANAPSLARALAAGGRDDAEVARLFAGITGWSGPFRSVVAAYGGPPGMIPYEVPATPEGERDARG